MIKFFSNLFGLNRECPPYGPRSPWANNVRKHPLLLSFRKALALHIYEATEETSEQSRSYWARWIGL